MPARLDGSIILNPGNLRHQITWQKKVVSGQNSTGEDVYTYLDVLTCRAKVQALGGTELEKAMQRWPDAEYEVTQHFYLGLATSLRISWFNDGAITYLDVLNIDDPTGTERYQRVICRTYEGSNFTA